MRRISGAQALMESLIAEGVTTIFGYPGGAIMPTYDALYDFRDVVRHVLVRHEQGAAHAAEGWARMAGRPGVCLATSGPGATNLVTGIADAQMDSIPLVCITGQVNKWALGTDAFQETDVISVTIPITKWNYQITSPEEVPFIVAKAFHIASSGRPGPVLIDITKNAQVDKFDYDESERKKFFMPGALVPRRIEAPALEKASLLKAAELINKAEKPYILAGHGILISGAEEQLQAVAERADIPVALTLHGLSAFPTRHNLSVGMLGMHGNYGPNLLTNSADVIIAVGMRFDDRVTGDLRGYATRAEIIHIEIDPAEIGKVMKPAVGIVGDAKHVLSELLPLLEKKEHPEWIAEFRACEEEEYNKVIRPAVGPAEGPLKMSEVVHKISEHSKGEAVVVADVGQHQMMAARYYKFARPDSWITSGGLGTMGFALPAAYGAKVAKPEREVIAIIGDGSFQMNSQELMTIAQENIPVKAVILNNGFLGMVRQWQELFFDNRYSFVEMKNPDFVKLGEAYGIRSLRVSDRAELDGAIQEMLQHDGPFLLEAVVENEQNVFPMVPAGATVSQIRLE
jgi:acetolactate synthase I/II/III large subunit